LPRNLIMTQPWLLLENCKCADAGGSAVGTPAPHFLITVLSSNDTTKIENNTMPPPTDDGSGPGPSAALLPCRERGQISNLSPLRASSSNSLCFLTPGRAKGLIAFGSQWAGPIARRELCCRYVAAEFLYKTHMAVNSCQNEN